MIKYLKKNSITILIFLFFIFCIALVYILQDKIGLESILESSILIKNLISDNYALSIVFIIFILVIGICLMVPLTPLVLITGYYFGTLNSIYICFVGEFIGSLIVYLYSRYFFYSLFSKITFNKFNFYKDKFNENSFYYLILLRIIGGIPFSIQCILCGILKMPIKIYSIATLIGILPYIYIYSSIGANFSDILELQDFKLTQILSPEYLVPIILLVILIFLPKFFKSTNAK